MADVATAPPPAEVSDLNERLAQRELDYNELHSIFTKYKLKQKVKYDKLRDEVLAYVKKNGVSNEKETNAMLMIRLTETEGKLDEAERRAEALTRELQRRQAQISDQLILMRNLEDQLRVRRPTETERLERRRALEMIDVESIHAQMTHKDERIIELNNVILDRERQILDLQELVREHDEVANSKKQAMRLVQKRFEELGSVTRRSIGTETDSALFSSNQPLVRHRHDLPARTIRGSSPGRAVKGPVVHGSSSPPPLDPSEDFIDDVEAPGPSGSHRRQIDPKKSKKLRVTFDLPSGSTQSVVERGSPPDDTDEITHAINDLTAENEHLRNVVDRQNAEISGLQSQLLEVNEETTRVERSGRSAVAKARVVAQARVKDLEEKMTELHTQLSSQIESLQAQNETLRSTREWEIEENAKLRDELAKTKEKLSKLTEEVDAAVITNRDLEDRITEEHSIMDSMIEDLEQAEAIIVGMEEEKVSLLDDMETMRCAILAQERFIEVLEADVVIYEEHIGILRESLGASKVDSRDLIKSKAFEAKLKALEEEKREIAKTRKDERLKTKALNAKLRMLESENEKLMSRLCEMEMRGNDSGSFNIGFDGLPTSERADELQRQLDEANAHISSLREEFDTQLATSRHELDLASKNADVLRNVIHDLEERLAFSSAPSDQQTELQKQKQFEAESNLLDAQSRVESLQTELEQLLSERMSFMDKINELGAENFDFRARIADFEFRLQTAESHALNNHIQSNELPIESIQQIEASNHLSEILSSENAHLRAELETANAQIMTHEKALAEVQQQQHAEHEELEDLRRSMSRVEANLQLVQIENMQLRERHWQNEIPLNASSNSVQPENSALLPEEDSSALKEELCAAKEQVRALRVELDSVRLSYQETVEVQKQVEILKAELDEERRANELKWAEVVERFAQSSPDSPAPRSSRKASLDEMTSYLDAYAEKCRKLEEELKETRDKIESSKEVSRTNSPSLEAELAACHSRVLELEEALSSNQQQLEQALAKQESDKQEKNKLKAAVKKLQAKLRRQEEQAEPCEARVNIVPVILAEDETQREPPIDVNEQVTDMTKRLQEAEIALYEKIRELAVLHAEMDDERNKGRIIAHELDQAKAHICELEALVLREKQRCYNTQQTLRSAVPETEPISSELLEKLSEASVENEDLRLEITRINALREEQAQELLLATQEIAALKQEVHTREQKLEEKISHLEQENLELSFRAENAEESFNFSDLQQEVTELNKKNECLQAKLSKALSRAELAEVERSTIQAQAQEELGSVRALLEERNVEIRDLQDQVNIAEQSSVLQEVIIEPSQTPVQHESLLRATVATSSAVEAMMTSQSQQLYNPSDWPQTAEHSSYCAHSVTSANENTPLTQAIQPTPAAPEVITISTQQAALPSNAELPIPSLRTSTEKDLFAENLLLRECINQSKEMHDSLSADVDRLEALRTELETALEALKGEVWSLNSQLKASVLDREQLADRIVELDTKLAAEQQRISQLDLELSEQLELTNRAQRQAAESENESNRRLDECREMEQRREHIEQAYAQLMQYYTQLHASYEALSSSQGAAEKSSSSTETDISGVDVVRGQDALRLYHTYREHFELTRDSVVNLRSNLQSLAQDLVQTDLPSVSASIAEHLGTLRSAVDRISQLRANPQDAEIAEFLNVAVANYGLVIPDNADLQEKLSIVLALLHAKIIEAEQSQKAVLMQQRICTSLEQRLTAIETTQGIGADVAAELTDTRRQLRERDSEVQEMQARIRELQQSIETLTTVHEEEQAARLATRQADVDALFRANAELAHTNVRLQNEIDEVSETQPEQAELERLRKVETSLNERLLALEQNLRDDRQRIAELEAELTRAHEESSHRVESQSLHTNVWEESASETVQELREQLANAERRVIDTNQELDETRERADYTAQELSSLRQQNDLLVHSVTSLSDSNDSANRRIDELQAALHASTTDNHSLQAQLQHEQARARAREDSVVWEDGHDEDRTDALDTERAARQKAEAQRDELKGKVQRLSEQLDQLETEFLDKMEEKENTERELRRRIEQLHTTGNDDSGAKDVLELEAALKRTQENLQRREDEAAELRIQLAELEERLSEERMEREDAERKLEQSSSMAAGNAWNNDDDWGPGVDEQDEQSSQHEKLFENEELITELRANIESLQAQLSDSQFEAIRLRTQLQEAERVQSEPPIADPWGWGEDEKNSSDDELVRDQQALIQKLEGELEDVRQQFAQVRAEAESLREKSENAWGWEEAKTAQNQESQTLEQELGELRINAAKEKEKYEQLESEMKEQLAILQEKLSNAEKLQEQPLQGRSEVDSAWSWGEENENSPKDDVKELKRNHEELVTELSSEIELLREELSQAHDEAESLRQQLLRAEPESKPDDSAKISNEADLKEKLDEAERQKDELRQTEIDLRNKIELLHQRLAQTEVEADELRQQILQAPPDSDWGWGENSESAKQNTAEEKVEYQEIINDLNNEIELLRETLSQSRDNAKSLQQKLEDTEAEIQASKLLQEQLAEAKRNNAEHEQKETELHNKIELLYHELSQVEAEAEDLRQSILSTKSDASWGWGEREEPKESNNEDSNKDHEAQENTKFAQELKDEIQFLQEDVCRFLTETNTLRQQLNKANAEIQAMKEAPKPLNAWGWGEEDTEEDTFDTAETDHTDIDSLRAQLHEATEKIHQQKECHDQVMSSLQAEVAELRTQLEEQQNNDETAFLKQTINAVQSELLVNKTAYDDTIASLRSELEALQLQHSLQSDAWDNDNAELESNAEQLVALQEQVKALEAQLQEGYAAYDALKNELVTEKRAKADTEQALEDLNNELEATRSRLTNVVSENVQKSDAVGDQLQELQALLKVKSLEVEEAQALQESLQHEVDEFLTRIAEMEAELSTYQTSEKQVVLDRSAEVEELKSKLEYSEKKCGLLMDSEARLLDQVDEYGAAADAHEQEVQRLLTVVTQLESQLLHHEQMQSRVAQLEAQLGQSMTSTASEKLEKEITRLREQLAAKESRIESLIAAKQAAEAELAAALQKFDDVIRERDALRAKYDELRRRVATPRQRTTFNAPATHSRRSSVSSTAPLTVDTHPEEPITSSAQHSPWANAATEQAAAPSSQDAFRRRRKN